LSRFCFEFSFFKKIGGTGIKDHVDKYLNYFKSADGEETAKLAHRLDKVNKEV
jgi:hypothetical protein